MLKNQKYAVYIVIALISLFILMDATSRYSKIAHKDKSQNTKQTATEAPIQNNDQSQNPVQPIQTTVPTAEEEPEEAYSNVDSIKSNIDKQKKKLVKKILTDEDEDAVEEDIPKAPEKNYYIKSTAFETIDTETFFQVYRKDDIILTAPLISGGPIYLILINDGIIVWKKVIYPLSMSYVRIESADISRDKINLRLIDKDKKSEVIGFKPNSTNDKEEIPLNYDRLYFSDNTPADNYQLITTFSINNGSQTLAVVEETEIASQASVKKKYYIYNMVNGYLYRNYFIFENYGKANKRTINNWKITSDKLYTVLKFNTPSPVVRKVSNSLLKNISNQNRNTPPLKYTYKYRIENIHIDAHVVPKQ